MASLRPDFVEIARLVEPNSRVLDLGCGKGELMAYLEEARGATSSGVEIRPERIVDCVGRGLSCCQGDIDEGLQDYQDACFDYVILSQTLHLVSRPGLVVREMLRVARRGIVSIPNFGYWRMRIGLLLRGRVPRAGCFSQSWDETPVGHVVTLSDFRDFARENHIAIEHESFVTSGGSLARRAARLAPNLFAQLGIYVLTSRAQAESSADTRS